MQIISDAIDEANTIEEYWWMAELYRLNGELLLQQSKPNLEKAMGRFRKALNTAHHQGSLMLELRAVTSLHRLCKLQGQHCDESGSLMDNCARWPIMHGCPSATF